MTQQESEALLESSAREFAACYIKDLELQLGPLPELLASTLRACCPFAFAKGAEFAMQHYDCYPKT